VVSFWFWSNSTDGSFARRLSLLPVAPVFSYNVASVTHSSRAVEKSEAALLTAAKAGNNEAFRELIEPLSRELSAYAYRMLGGFQDAEDALQETRLKAWRHLSSYQPNATFRAWVYRIATNTCLDMLRNARRRVLPQDVGSSVAPGPPTTEMRTDIAWLEPYPDALLPGAVDADPEQVLRLHQSVRLALVRALQVLPPRQRAALILHDVLDWSVDDVAVMLETTAPAVNSALQRARATVQTSRPEGEAARISEQKAEVIARFVEAWETGKFDALVAMLTEDAVMNMPPWVYWLDGRDAVVATMTSTGTWQGEPRPGQYRILPSAMNGQPAGLAYVRAADGRWTAVCLTVMTIDTDSSTTSPRISAMHVFVLPQHFATWGHPLSLESP
jgi:RNA polymerase sigma-70 factor (ECF subfamily)